MIFSAALAEDADRVLPAKVTTAIINILIDSEKPENFLVLNMRILPRIKSRKHSTMTSMPLPVVHGKPAQKVIGLTFAVATRSEILSTEHHLD